MSDSDLERSLSAAAGDIEAAPPQRPRLMLPPAAGMRTCASAPHSAVQFGTRIVVDGQAGHYVNFRLPAFSRIEHVVCFDDGGEQILRGDRCHFFRVLSSMACGLRSERQSAQGWTVAQDPGGGGAVTVSTITSPHGAEISITSQTTLADFRRSIAEELGIPAEEQRLLLCGTERLVVGPTGTSNSPFLWQLEESVLPGTRVLVVADPEHQQQQPQQPQRQQLPFEATFRTRGAAATDDDGALEPPLGWDWQLGFAGLSFMVLVFAAVVLGAGLRWTCFFGTILFQCSLFLGWHTFSETGTPRALAPKHYSGGINLASLGNHSPAFGTAAAAAAAAAAATIKPSGKRFLAVRGWEVAPHTVRGWTKDDMPARESSLCVSLGYGLARVVGFVIALLAVFYCIVFVMGLVMETLDPLGIICCGHDGSQASSA